MSIEDDGPNGDVVDLPIKVEDRTGEADRDVMIDKIMRPWAVNKVLSFEEALENREVPVEVACHPNALLELSPEVLRMNKEASFLVIQLAAATDMIRQKERILEDGDGWRELAHVVKKSVQSLMFSTARCLKKAPTQEEIDKMRRELIEATYNINRLKRVLKNVDPETGGSTDVQIYDRLYRFSAETVERQFNEIPDELDVQNYKAQDMLEQIYDDGLIDRLDVDIIDCAELGEGDYTRVIAFRANNYENMWNRVCAMVKTLREQGVEGLALHVTSYNGNISWPHPIALYVKSEETDKVAALLPEVANCPKEDRIDSENYHKRVSSEAGLNDHLCLVEKKF